MNSFRQLRTRGSQRRGWAAGLAAILAALSLAASASASSDGATAWGDNLHGELGVGTEVGPQICYFYNFHGEFRPKYCSTFPLSVPGPIGVTAVSAGEEHSLALLSDGTVMAWGSDQWGQLGDGSTGGLSSVPVAVSGLSGVTAISAGKFDSLALLSNGKVMAWGDDGAGELGDGKTGEGSNVPVAVSGLSGVTAISAGKGTNVIGDTHNLALLSDGTVVAWGNNGQGELGNGKMGGISDVPVAVKGLSGVVAISAGVGFSLAALESGTAMAWGTNGQGQLGDGTTASTDLPAPVSAASGVTAVSAGAEHSLALLSNGTVLAWGANLVGQLGDGSSGGISDVPVAVSGLSSATAVSAGGIAAGGEDEHSLALLSNGTIMGWGSGISGQLDAASTNVPEPAAGLTGVKGVSAGGEFSLAFGPPVPGLVEVAPGQGPEAGGSTVTITGVHLTGATAVDFGSTGASFTVNSDSSITAVSPPGIGPVDVTVTTPEGTSPTSATDRFTYGVPTVTKIAHANGPLVGGTSVTISGTNFTRTTAVTFGSVNASSFTVKSPTQITAIAPPATTVGFVYVIVTTPGGTNAVSKKDVFHYAPTVTGVSPNTGPSAGGTSVTVTGTGFAGGSVSVTFGSTKATAVSCASSTKCTMLSPAHAAGTVDVKVRVKGTQSNGVINVASPRSRPGDQFTYG